MTQRIALFSPGLIRLKPEIRILSGLDPHLALLSVSGDAAVGGWGHKPTAKRARAAAARANLPYFAFEDGFIRSLRPGSAEPPLSMVMDRSGIYYDARSASDLETMIETVDLTAEDRRMARAVMTAISHHRLSKYNHGSDALDGFDIPAGKPVVLAIDQTWGDESVAGSLSDAATFERMVQAAVAENPGAFVVAKLHPDTLAGAKSGYIEAAARRLGARLLASPVSPWALLDRKPRVYTVSSQFGFEALMAGCQVTCFGMPFYAGWGLTDDRVKIARRTRKSTVEDLAAFVYLRYCRYFDAWRRTPIDALTAIDQMAFLRRSFLANARPVVGFRITRWKRRAVRAMLDGPAGPPRFTSSLAMAKVEARKSGAAIAAWGIDAVRLRPELQRDGLGCIAIEDGFLRSVGLGAAFAPPLSLVFDAVGLYYDPTRPSAIEQMLSAASLTPEDVERGQALRREIIAARITKYNLIAPSAIASGIPRDKPVVVVPGQVADDWAVMIGRPPDFPAGANVNDILLERARDTYPGAFVIFKPHPDVEHLGRAGALEEGRQKRLSDLVASNVPFDVLLPLADRIETYSSLAGFEALVRGIPVTVHGMPFYAGWGLTDDKMSCPRRTRNRSLDELVTVALLHYPRYWDPVSGRVCPAEVALHRIAQARTSRPGASQRLGVALGRGVILARRIGQLLKGHGDGA